MNDKYRGAWVYAPMPAIIINNMQLLLLLSLCVYVCEWTSVCVSDKVISNWLTG